MDNSHVITLYYGYQESTEGRNHAFVVEDAADMPETSRIPYELAELLGTIPEDRDFNWDTLSVEIPEATVIKLRQEGMQLAAEAARQPRKTYTLDHFRAKTNEKRLTATGWVTAERIAQCINYSSILTSLIKTAGRLVDSYASDLFITWNAMIKELDMACANGLNPETDSVMFRRSYLYGFREMGVDDSKAVLAWYNDAEGNRGHFREIWRLDVNIGSTGNIRAELYEVNKTV